MFNFFLLSSLLFLPFIKCETLESFGYVDQNDHIVKIINETRLVNGSICWGKFSNNINTTGWAQLEIHTNKTINDSIQAYAAGYLEGKLTSSLINLHWINMASDYCNGSEKYCQNLKQFLEINLNFINNEIEQKRSKEPYWHQVGLILEQLAGLEDGYKGVQWKGPRRNIDVMGLLILSASNDIEDLESVLKKTGNLKRVLGSGSCPALIKLLPNNTDLYVAHDTWSVYNSMLRINKLYDFNFHFSPDENSFELLIPGRKMSFSSYPGIIASNDDFYIMSSGLVTLETTIENDNMELYINVKPDKIVFEWIRALVSVFLYPLVKAP